MRGSWAGGKWERCCGVDVRVAEEAEVDRKMEGRVPPCVDGSGGEAARDVRRAWAWRSAVEGSGGVEDSKGRGGKMAGGGGRCVLVTGGAGFIGSHCCVDLLEAGYDVVVVSPTPPALARAPTSSRVHIDWRRVGARLKGMRVRV